MNYFFTIIFILHVHVTYGLLSTPRVENLQGISDFRSVILTWTLDLPSISTSRDVIPFLIRYCERDGWDKGRPSCEARTINITSGGLGNGGGSGQRYGAVVDGLHSATTYLFHVTPVEFLLTEEQSSIIDSGLFVTTKGFRARVARCLQDFSEVEVWTGPYFGGIVAVEGATDARCLVKGDSTSSITKYIILINHSLCNSRQVGHYMQNIIIASENPNVITQTSRRFQVVCDVVPENYTLHTGVNVPDIFASDNSASSWQQLKRGNIENQIMNRNRDETEVVVGGTLENPRQEFHVEQEGETSELQLVIVGAMLSTVAMITLVASWWWWRRRRRVSDSSSEAPESATPAANQNAGDAHVALTLHRSIDSFQ